MERTAVVGQSQASSLSALLLCLEQGMVSLSPHSGLLEKLFQYIDLHQDEFVQILKEWVAIESDSVQPVPRLRQELFRMMALAADKLRNLGARVDSAELGSQQMPDGQSLPIPPIILAELGNDPKKPTVCFYGHLDVQPAQKDDGWLTHPYTLTEVDGKLYGRGATDNKGPVLAWINAMSTFRALQQDLPVNIKFVLEGMEEAGSVALEELVRREKDHFFSGVDYIVISDNLWLSQRKPALTHGTRGNCYFTVEVFINWKHRLATYTLSNRSFRSGFRQKVKCRDQDFHSGTFGGILNEPMTDLIALLGSLVDSSGHILIPGIYDQVAPITEEEKTMYKNIDLDLEEYQKSNQVEKFLFDTKEELLMHLWRYPSLSIHGIEGAFDEPGTKNSHSRPSPGKIFNRLVPSMTPSMVEKQQTSLSCHYGGGPVKAHGWSPCFPLVAQHLEAVFSKRNSFNKMAVSMVLGLHPWTASVNDTQYLAAHRAIKTVFGVDPDMIQDGSTIPVAKIFQAITQKSVMMLPLGAVDDGEHSQNEKINS
ncbi:Beta-Ala-His dipeptidase [Apodemus speciosus]|uniref:Beta-Ala-His dipeptidase n=1 Tax=Apodemus speciosus TaxID=105296 RepID=A0ABQ0FRP8_APOSI